MGKRATEPARHGQKGFRAEPGLVTRAGGTTRPDTKSHRVCIVASLFGPGQIGLELGSGRAARLTIYTSD
jgi:hypothetical protein